MQEKNAPQVIVGEWWSERNSLGGCEGLRQGGVGGLWLVLLDYREEKEGEQLERDARARMRITHRMFLSPPKCRKSRSQQHLSVFLWAQCLKDFSLMTATVNLLERTMTFSSFSCLDYHATFNSTVTSETGVLQHPLGKS